MTSPSRDAASVKPPIHLIDAEYDLIAELAVGLERKAPELARMLLDEIDRADVHTADAMPAGVVTIGSKVAVRDEHTSAVRELSLVLPADADVDAGRVSILTPIGAGLIGLREGQSILWPYPNGDTRLLKILSVTRPA